MKRAATILSIFLVIAGQARAFNLTTAPPISSKTLTEAKKVGSKVGPLVKEARSLAHAKNYKGALAKLNEADAVKSTLDEATVINYLRHKFEVASSGAPPLTPRATPQFPQL